MEVRLTGYANDYVAKGMAGGRVVVSPSQADDEAAKKAGRKTSAAQHSVVGNTVLYGATGGKLFVRGRGGERFAVRNSGAVAVVEGLGDHGCEYMTGGVVVCLGNTGRNFGAGLTGGLAFVIEDEAFLDGAAAKPFLPFNEFVNPETFSLQKLTPEHKAAKAYLVELLEAHVSETGSERAARLLKNIDQAISKIWVAVPPSEKTNPLIQTEAKASAGVGAAVSN
jgi:glutamate synthase domain-containing protein 3